MAYVVVWMGSVGEKETGYRAHEVSFQTTELGRSLPDSRLLFEVAGIVEEVCPGVMM